MSSEMKTPPLAWRSKSACYGAMPQRFYPEDWEIWDEEEIAKVKSEFCDQCPVREDCLDFAIGTREIEGMWGGLTHSERKSYIRRMRKDGKPVPRYSAMGTSLAFTEF